MSKKTINIGKHTIVIKQIKMKHLADVSKAFLPFVDEFEAIANKGTPMNRSDMINLIAKHSIHTLMLAEILTDKDVDFYEDFTPLEFYELMSQLVVYSGDFFLTQVLQPLQKVVKKMTLIGLTTNYYSENMAIQKENS